MKEQFCNYEISLKLKELGFNEECMGAYMIRSSGDKYFSQISSMKPNYSKWDIYVPLWQQAQSFLREKYNLHIVIDKVCNLDNTITFWNYEICFTNSEDILMEDKYRGLKSYEQAREAAILKCIELLKSK